MAAQPTLVFVYNADSGAFNALADMAHKIFSPQTYACNLCAITYSPLGMRKEWKEFLAGLDVELEFLHADELKSRYGIENVPLPAIFVKRDGRPELWIDAAAINRCRDMSDLQVLIAGRLAGAAC